MKKVIVSISSDIGTALANRWLGSGDDVIGTFRTSSNHLNALKEMGAQLHCIDLAIRGEIPQPFQDACLGWDVLVLSAGTTEPIGNFADSDFSLWRNSFEINFTAQIEIIHTMLPRRATAGKPTIILFAGGGTNSAPARYSAYTVSKIALIKFTELLAVEQPDVKITIVGPGWVKTKIHDETMRAGEAAGPNLKKTQEMFASDRFTPMEDVLDCCDWIVKTDGSVVSGRNFSVVHDAWRSGQLNSELQAKPDMYKLRRSGNDWKMP